MSMELIVLSEARLNTMAERQRAVDAEGFPLRFSDEVVFSELGGFLPSYLNDRQTGFECQHVDPREIVETYDRINFGREWKYALVILWGRGFYRNGCGLYGGGGVFSRDKRCRI